MKKIVGILGMAAVLATSVFAAQPEAKFVLADFSGSAEFGWKADFANTDDVKMGMFNGTTAGIKFGLITEGTRETSGDGIWGDLQIKFADGLNWAAELDGDPDGKLGALAAPSVEVAKIHFVDGDFSAALNILKPKLEAPGASAPSAIGAPLAAVAANDITGTLDAGFALETKLNNVFSLDVKFMDKGFVAAKDQNFGLGFNAALLAIENLTAKAGVVMNFETEETALGTELGYTYKFDDKLYVKPGAGFTMYKKAADDAAMAVEAGALFGWGAVDQEPGFKWVADKTTEGISVAVHNDLKFKDTEVNTTKVIAGLYDQSLLSLVGDAEDVGTLKLGAKYVMDLVSGKDATKLDNEIALGARYAITFAPVTVSLGADLDLDMDQDVEAKVAYLLNAKISADVIDNTDLYVEYNIGDVAGAKKIDTNNVTIGTKIHF